TARGKIGPSVHKNLQQRSETQIRSRQPGVDDRSPLFRGGPVTCLALAVCQVHRRRQMTSRYERLCEDKRTARRTVADALEVLRERAGFADRDCAEICVGLLKLRSAEVVGVVQLLFDVPFQGKTYVVSLPTAGRFYARQLNSSQRDCFAIAKLDRAITDSRGTVLLADGTTLRAGEVSPANLPLEPT